MTVIAVVDAVVDAVAAVTGVQLSFLAVSSSHTQERDEGVQKKKERGSVVVLILHKHGLVLWMTYGDKEDSHLYPATFG